MSNPSTSEHALDDSYWESLFEEEDAVPTDVGNSMEGNMNWPVETLLTPPPVRAEPPKVDCWKLAQEIYEEDDTLVLAVTGFNKGGLLVNWKGIQGFVPASQLVNLPVFHVERERLEALKEWQGRMLNLKIIEVNPSKQRLILSERAAQVEAGERERLLRRLESGDELEGEVTNLTDFGAFVDLGGVEGLIHISELSWSRVIHPSHILRPGQRVRVQVLNLDKDNGRVALTYKRLKQNPWKDVESRYQAGQEVVGTIGHIANYGAFVVLEEELEGLIHVSELAEGNFLHPRNVVARGQEVKARILSVDGANKRIALSLRQA